MSFDAKGTCGAAIKLPEWARTASEEYIIIEEELVLLTSIVVLQLLSRGSLLMYPQTE